MMRISGFTLVELIVVVVILGIILILAVLGYRKYIYKAKVITAVSDINSMEKAIYGYTIDSQGALPPDLTEINYGSFEDPWERTYVYAPDLTLFPRVKGGSNINTDYDLYSVGRDGLSSQEITASNSMDDIIRADLGRFKGLAEHY